MQNFPESDKLSLIIQFINFNLKKDLKLLFSIGSRVCRQKRRNILKIVFKKLRFVSHF